MRLPTVKRKAKRVPRICGAKTKPEPIAHSGLGAEMPPHKRLVEIYFDQKEMITQADVFYEHYEQAKWCSPKGTPYRNWKLLAGDWIFNYLQERKLEKRQRENALL